MKKAHVGTYTRLRTPLRTPVRYITRLHMIHQFSTLLIKLFALYSLNVMSV